MLLDDLLHLLHHDVELDSRFCQLAGIVILIEESHISFIGIW